jgi:hypothetical protein
MDLILKLATYFGTLRQQARQECDSGDSEEVTRFAVASWYWMQQLDHTFFGATEETLKWGAYRMREKLEMSRVQSGAQGAGPSNAADSANPNAAGRAIKTPKKTAKSDGLHATPLSVVGDSSQR